jgi:hypothetical protein
MAKLRHLTLVLAAVLALHSAGQARPHQPVPTPQGTAIEVVATTLHPGPDGQLLLTAFTEGPDQRITVHANSILSPGAVAVLKGEDGRTIGTHGLSGADTVIDLAALPAGTYTLTAHDGERPLGAFRVIKR